MLERTGLADLIVRRVETPTDFERFSALLTDYEAALPADLRHKQPSSNKAPGEIYRGRSAAFLAFVDGRAAGCVAVREIDARTAVLKRLFVDPRHRGIGAARALVETALGFLKEQRYGRVVLDTEKHRLRRAYELYVAFGFRECPPYGEVDYACPTFMELDLAGAGRPGADDRI